MSLIEAAAAGLPAVATDVGGVTEVVADGETGIIVPREDVSSLASALIRMSEDASARERMGRDAQKRVLSRYGVDRLLDDIKTLYGSLL